jgi:hypothetical protein
MPIPKTVSIYPCTRTATSFTVNKRKKRSGGSWPDWRAGTGTQITVANTPLRSTPLQMMAMTLLRGIRATTAAPPPHDVGVQAPIEAPTADFFFCIFQQPFISIYQIGGCCRLQPLIS